MRIIKNISNPLLGIFLYSISSTIVTLLGLDLKFRLIIQMPALLLIIWGLMEQPRTHHKMYDTNGLMNFLYSFYVLLLIIMVLRGYNLSGQLQDANIIGLLNIYFGSSYNILWVFMPFVALRMYPYDSIRWLIKICCWVCVICSVITIIHIPEIMTYSLMSAMEYDFEEYMPALSYGRIGLSFSAFLLLLGYLNTKQRWIIIITYTINVLVCILCARRGDLAMSLLLVVFCLWMYFNKGKNTQKVGIVFLTVFIVGLYFAISSSSIFTFLGTRGFEDSRSDVEESMFLSMNSFELWFGKGLNGTYYWRAIQSDRFLCETGFYNIVLKGGYLMAVTYVILMIVPAIKGIFRSKNTFCKAGGLYILWNLIYLYPSGLLSFNIRFFFIWMWVILCSIPSVREMSDYEIKLKYF